MNEGMENIKTIDSLEKEIWDLKKEIDSLKEELQLLEIIERDHKELAAMKIANKKLEDKILEFTRPTKRRIDDI